MKPIIGPVIGRVTDTTARILLEYDTDVQVTVTVISNQDNSEKILTKTLKSKRPTIFKFDNLNPNTKYTVKVFPYENDLVSGFKTFKRDTDEKNMRIAWVSCNDQNKIGSLKDKNLWFFLAEEVQLDTYDLVCHIGDQVYLDSDLWNSNRNNVYVHLQEQIFNKYPQTEWVNYQEQIKEIIREEYRRAWTFQPTAFVLANVSNICLLDDHEVRDGWGWQPEDWNSNSTKCDYFYGRMCQQVYYEYQRQLRDDNLDLNNTSKIKEEYFTMKQGKIGFFFLDVRGDRSWHRLANFDESKMMSTAQWDRLDQALGQEFQDIENLIIVSQSTIVFLNKVLTKISGAQAQDSLEQWALHQDQQVSLLNKLYGWKYQNPSKLREVTIICGDVHLGGHTDIFYKNQPAFKQLTASSITNGLNKKYEKIVAKVALDASDEIKDGWSFRHHSWTTKNNYGFQHIFNKQQSNGQIQNVVECCNVVYSQNDNLIGKKFQYLKMFDNLTYYKQKKNQCSDCCSIF